MCICGQQHLVLSKAAVRAIEARGRCVWLHSPQEVAGAQVSLPCGYIQVGDCENK